MHVQSIVPIALEQLPVARRSRLSLAGQPAEDQVSKRAPILIRDDIVEDWIDHRTEIERQARYDVEITHRFSEQLGFRSPFRVKNLDGQ